MQTNWSEAADVHVHGPLVLMRVWNSSSSGEQSACVCIRRPDTLSYCSTFAYAEPGIARPYSRQYCAKL
jgi:hypothetical protein